MHTANWKSLLFDAYEQTAFVEEAKKTYMGRMYIFALCTGMRQGELMGLQWKDIDDKDELHITRTIRKTIDPDNGNDKWHLEYGEPKPMQANGQYR